MFTQVHGCTDRQPHVRTTDWPCYQVSLKCPIGSESYYQNGHQHTLYFPLQRQTKPKSSTTTRATSTAVLLPFFLQRLSSCLFLGHCSIVCYSIVLYPATVNCRIFISDIYLEVQPIQRILFLRHLRCLGGGGTSVNSLTSSLGTIQIRLTFPAMM